MVSQIYSILNNIASQRMGMSANAVVDTTSFASFGKLTLDSAENTDAFGRGLMEVLSATFFHNKIKEVQERYVLRNDQEWGGYVRTIRRKARHNATTDAAYVTSPQANPFDTEIQTEFIQKIFGNFGVWEYSDVIESDQLFTAFNSEADMEALIAIIYAGMEESYNQDINALNSMAIESAMAYAMLNGCAINVLGLYNAAHPDATITSVEAARSNADYMKFRNRQIKRVWKFMQEQGPRYTPEKYELAFLKPEDAVFEILTDAAEDMKMYLNADTYHDNYLTLPNYNEVAFWHGRGTSDSYADVSTIAVKNTDLTTTTNEQTEITKSGVFACIRAKDAVATYIGGRKSGSIYNPKADRLNFFVHAKKNYGIDGCEVCVVFYDEV